VWGRLVHREGSAPVGEFRSLVAGLWRFAQESLAQLGLKTPLERPSPAGRPVPARFPKHQSQLCCRRWVGSRAEVQAGVRWRREGRPPSPSELRSLTWACLELRSGHARKRGAGVRVPETGPAHQPANSEVDENTVADVVFCFGSILIGFSKSDDQCETLMACVESRWAECEQPLFILGVFLHPIYYEQSNLLRSTPLTSPANLEQVAIYYSRRLFGAKPTSLAADYRAWREGHFTAVPLANFQKCSDYWSAVKEECTQQGRPTELPDLSLAILSIVVNTATCERLFSELGLLHTAVRN
jgi:hypothetical protein